MCILWVIFHLMILFHDWSGRRKSWRIVVLSFYGGRRLVSGSRFMCQENQLQNYFSTCGFMTNIELCPTIRYSSTISLSTQRERERAYFEGLSKNIQFSTNFIIKQGEWVKVLNKRLKIETKQLSLVNYYMILHGICRQIW